MNKIIIEPFRIKSVEPISINTKIDREKIIKDASTNYRQIKSGR